ncbi:MAG: zinc-ribbon domain containing protein [Chloroflexi bacterium]|nr:zinc-ribbon domain containing protein [Chloroflexota bacterium]
MSFTDQTLTCRDCGQEFVWTAGEQAFYQTRGLTNQPRRCPSCRQARKGTTGGGSYGGSSLGGFSSGGGYERAPRQMYPATCDNCGKQTEVPFQPTSGKPVYCSDCFRERRASLGNSGGGGSSYGSRY